MESLLRVVEVFELNSFSTVTKGWRQQHTDIKYNVQPHPDFSIATTWDIYQSMH